AARPSFATNPGSDPPRSTRGFAARDLENFAPETHGPTTGNVSCDATSAFATSAFAAPRGSSIPRDRANHTEPSHRVQAIVNIRERVISALQVRNQARIELALLEVVKELIELDHVFVEPPRCVRNRGPRRHDEGPIARLQ